MKPMRPLHILSTIDQVAAHLVEEISRGALTKELPGVWTLAEELGVNHKTVLAAICALERKGLLLRQGAGRRCVIVSSKRGIKPTLRIKILLREPEELRVHLLLDAKDNLNMAGHIAEYADQTLAEMKMDVRRVARLVKRTPADAWVVTAGSSEVLAWFGAQPIPTFALFGRLHGLPLAGVGTTKLPAIIGLVRRLGALGHRRIIYLVREEHRGPTPSPVVRAFLDELAALGIPHGPYNVPNWEDSPEGFHQCLNALFKHTPPTALILDESMLYFTALQFMAARGIRPLQDVSMICTDSTPYLEWLNPKVSHIGFDSRPLIQRMIRWADNVARGKVDRRQFFANANLIEGGTIGPVPRM